LSYAARRTYGLDSGDLASMKVVLAVSPLRFMPVGIA